MIAISSPHCPAESRIRGSRQIITLIHTAHTHSHSHISSHMTFTQSYITTVTPAYTCTHKCSEVHTHTYTVRHKPIWTRSVLRNSFLRDWPEKPQPRGGGTGWSWAGQTLSVVKGHQGAWELLPPPKGGLSSHDSGDSSSGQS